MKKKLLKIVSFTMAMLMMFQTPLTLFADSKVVDSIGSINMEDDGVSVGVDKTQEQQTTYSEEITNESLETSDNKTLVYVSQASSFGVFIPKVIVLSGQDKNANYLVNVDGNIGGEDTINVVPEETFTLSQFGKNDIIANVSQDKVSWLFNELDIDGNGSIVANDMTAGSWSGKFDFEISLNNVSTSSDSLIKVEAKDENGNDLNANAYTINGKEKEDLMEELIKSNLVDGITSVEDVDALIEVKSNDFENLANTTFDVSNIAQDGDTVIIVHYDEETREWEYVGTKIVEDGKVSADFDSYSPVGFIVVKEDGTTHTHEYVLEGTDVTCVEDGLYTCTCECGDVINLRVPAKGHNYNIEIEEPTCTKNGTKVYFCNACDYSYTEELPAFGHDYSVVTKEATCTKGSRNVYTCNICKNAYTETLTSALGHNYIDGYCERCNKEYIEAGLYDANGVMLCTWEESGIDVEIGYSTMSSLPNCYKETKSSPYYVLTNKYPTAIKIALPNSTTSIGNNAFYECNNLTSVIIPDSVTSIEKSAFRKCSGLTNVVIPDSVTSIGSSAFDKCVGLTSMIIPDSVTNIGNYAFQECTGLSSVTIDDGVSSIGDFAFSNCTNLTSVVIPNSVTSIGSSAFEGCTKLTSITIPDGVTSISSGAFSRCYALTNVTIPDGVTLIGSMAFYGCDGLTSIDSKGSGASIEIPSSIESINSSAFSCCDGLINVTIPDSVTSIGEKIFYDCKNLSNITIGNGCGVIGNSAFAHCSKLKNAIIGNNVTSIEEYAFAYSGLSCVTIPNSVESIGKETFTNCSGLTNVTIGNGVTSIGEKAFYHCSGLTSVNIPNSVTFIDRYAFCGCYALTDVTIPNTVTSIGERAFSNVPHIYYNGTATGSPWGAYDVN